MVSDKIFIFLDIDGVLNGGFRHELIFRDCDGHKKIGWEGLTYGLNPGNRRGDWVIQSLLERLEQLIASYGDIIQVVIISAWAHDDEGAHAIKFNMPINQHGYYETYQGPGRGEAIRRFMDERAIRAAVILDDCWDRPYWYDVPGFYMKDYCVPIHGRYAMTDANFEDLKERLDFLVAIMRPTAVQLSD